MKTKTIKTTTKKNYNTMHKKFLLGIFSAVVVVDAIGVIILVAAVHLKTNSFVVACT